MKGLYSKSAMRSPRENEAPPSPNPDSFYGSGSSFYSSAMISPEGRGNNGTGGAEKQRKTKLEKIRELLEENRKLKDTTWQLQDELRQKELQIRQLDGRHQNQHIPGEGTKEEHPEGKHMDALRALTAVTKTQQESLAAHHERYEQLSREFEEREMESKQLRRDLHKKKKEMAMLEKEIDSNLLEITGLRKELAQALQASERSETEIRGDRRKILELSREVALLKAGRNGAPNDVKMIADKINVFDEEMNQKDSKIELQQVELDKQRGEIQRLQVELERTQEQVEEYEQERDATVADMERYYEALKFELEEKSRLLEEAEQEKAEIDMETTAALRTLEERCNQLNTEVLDAHDEISVLRRESDATNFSSVVKSETAKNEEFEEERQRLNSNLEAMSTELNSLKQRHEEMLEKHSEACKALEQENDELKRHHSDLKSALREANVHNRTISEQNHVLRVENDSLLTVSRDLKLKVREMQAGEERIVPAAVTQSESDQDQSRASGLTLVDASLSTPFNPINLEVVPESSESIGSSSHGEKGTDKDSSCLSGGEPVVDQEGSPTSSDHEPSGQQALLLAVTQSQSSPANSDDDVTPSGQQALLLAAAAGRQKQKVQPESKSLNNSWRSMIKRGQSNSPLPPIAGSNLSTSSDTDSEIKRLEKINREQKETIQKLQSELVRLNAFYRDAAYLSKRKMESLVNENAAYEIKIIVLEKMLENMGESTDTRSSSGSVGDAAAARSEASNHNEATPEGDSSSLSKNLDQFKELAQFKKLEEKVMKLEKEKSDAEEKMKAVVTDLENYQRTSQRAALDSMQEIERLKKDNTEKERRLSMLQNETVDTDYDASERGAVGEYDE